MANVRRFKPYTDLRSVDGQDVGKGDVYLCAKRLTEQKLNSQLEIDDEVDTLTCEDTRVGAMATGSS